MAVVTFSFGASDRFSGVILLLLGGYLSVLVLRSAAHELYDIACFQQTVATVSEYVAPGAEGNAKEPREEGHLTFRYSVAGAEYSGRLAGEDLCRCSPLRKILEVPHAVGDFIEVYHHPDDPGHNKILPIVEPIRFIVLAFCLPFLLRGAMQTIRPSIFQQTPDRDISQMPGAVFETAYMVFSILSGIGLIFVVASIPWQAVAILGTMAITVAAPLGALAITRWLNPSRKAGAAFRDRDLPIRRENRQQSIVLACFAVFWWGILSVFLWGMASTFSEYLDSSRYETTEGKITESKLHELVSYKGSRKTHTSWQPTVTYTYAVGQANFTGNRIVIGQMPYSGPYDAAERYLTAYPEGSKVTVLYDPQNPKRAALEVEFWRHHAFLVFFLVPFVVVGVLMAALAIWSFKTGKVIDSVPSDSRLAMGLFAWFAAHGLSAVVLGFADATNPENAELVWIGVVVVVVVTAFAALVGPSMIGARSRNSRWRRGR